MNFMFEWQEQYLTRSLRSLVRYCSQTRAGGIGGTPSQVPSYLYQGGLQGNLFEDGTIDVLATRT